MKFIGRLMLAGTLALVPASAMDEQLSEASVTHG